MMSVIMDIFAEILEGFNMNRYLLFAGQFYYPNGGWGDFIISVETEVEVDKAIELMIADKENPNTWFHVFDTESQKIIRSGGFSGDNWHCRWSS